MIEGGRIPLCVVCARRVHRLYHIFVLTMCHK